MYKVKVFFSNM